MVTAKGAMLIGADGYNYTKIGLGERHTSLFRASLPQGLTRA